METDSQTKVIVIGSETEYAAQGKLKPNSKEQIHPMWLVPLILGQAGKFLASFEDEMGGATTTLEHIAAEEEAARSDDIDLTFASPDELSVASLQRHGMTGLFTQNGARLYYDGGHPEGSRPEVTDPREAVIVEKAVDTIMLMSVKRTEVELKRQHPEAVVRLIKNNSDGKGHSYAAHECYSLREHLFRNITRGSRVIQDAYYRGTPCLLGRELADAQKTLTYFVVRQIITGSGKVGDEMCMLPTPEELSGAEGFYSSEEYEYSQIFSRRFKHYVERRGKEFVPAVFQISQRADFMKNVSTRGTTHMRGIINTREISYAGEGIERFHVIVGDNNLSELSLFLKYGMSALFFMMLEDGSCFEKGDYFSSALREPVFAHHAISRDLSLQEKIDFVDGRQATAREVMEEFAARARTFVGTNNLPTVYSDVLDWLDVALKDLATNRHKGKASSSLDWVILEKILLSEKKKNENISLQRMRDVDLVYHNLDPARSFYSRYVDAGKCVRIVRDEEINRAIIEPPTDTRAWLRGELVKRYRREIFMISWHFVTFGSLSNCKTLYLPLPHRGGKKDAEKFFAGDPLISEFLSRIEREALPWAIVTKHGKGE